MQKTAIYFSAQTIDVFVERGLVASQCKVHFTHTIGDTMQALLQHGARSRAMRLLRRRRNQPTEAPILIAEVQSGALALLDILQEQKVSLPPTLLIDRIGNDIQVPLRALIHGVRDYLLPEDAPEEREKRTRALVDRYVTVPPASKPALSGTSHLSPRSDSLPSRQVWLTQIELLRWDPVSHTIHIGDDDYVQLSPMEGRTFDLLYSRRGKTVSIDELIDTTLAEKDTSAMKNIQLLRTHLARLRRRLADHPRFGYRIENMRGAGYTLI